MNRVQVFSGFFYSVKLSSCTNLMVVSLVFPDLCGAATEHHTREGEFHHVSTWMEDMLMTLLA